MRKFKWFGQELSKCFDANFCDFVKRVSELSDKDTCLGPEEFRYSDGARQAYVLKGGYLADDDRRGDIWVFEFENTTLEVLSYHAKPQSIYVIDVVNE